MKEISSGIIVFSAFFLSVREMGRGICIIISVFLAPTFRLYLIFSFSLAGLYPFGAGPLVD